MVHTRSPGKFSVKRSGRAKVGFHGRIFGRILSRVLSRILSWILCWVLRRILSRIFGRIFDFSNFSSLILDFGVSIRGIIHNTQVVLLNARVPVPDPNRGQISRHFWSACWSDFW